MCGDKIKPHILVAIDGQVTPLGALQPLDGAIARELAEHLDQALSGLESRQAHVLRVRYGIGTGDDHTLADLGRELGVSRERVRQIETEALGKLAAGLMAEH